jgi:hypothetical protein
MEKYIENIFNEEINQEYAHVSIERSRFLFIHGSSSIKQVKEPTFLIYFSTEIKS